MNEVSREGFVPRHMRGRDIGPATCQWYHISVSTWASPVRPCREPEDITAGVHLCKTHIRRIGYMAGLYNQKQLEEAVQARTEAIREENKRLRQQLNWQARRLRGEIKEPAKAAPTDGTIYALQSGYHIKIGWTSNLPKRMKAYPPSSVLLVAYPGTRADEAKLKRRFAHLATHGREWFATAPQVLEWVDDMTTKHGKPEQPVFGAKRVEVPRPHADKTYVKPRGWVPGTGEISTGKTA